MVPRGVGAGWFEKNWIADNREWKGAILDRVRRMLARDKNHPAVIIWSVGNEAGTGANLENAYHYAKAMDASRPVAYVTIRGCLTCFIVVV
jgi:beta-galactosidase